MPEGPEVWILSKAINLFLSKNKDKNMELAYVNNFGKHLILHYKDDAIIDWSFGLTGKVYMDKDYKLNKIYNSYLSGGFRFIDNTYYENISSICWMNNDTNNETLQKIIDKWKTSKKKLGMLLVEQNEISGIGIAWGSEILFRCNLRPDIKACDQNLDNLCSQILNIKYEIKNIYREFLKKHENNENNENNLMNFINDWFENLYQIRNMNIYKKGKKITISGRNWWVKDE